MKGYIVLTREKTLNARSWRLIGTKYRGSFEGGEVKVLAAYGKHEVLEGDETEGS